MRTLAMVSKDSHQFLGVGRVFVPQHGQVIRPKKTCGNRRGSSTKGNATLSFKKRVKIKKIKKTDTGFAKV